MFALLNTHTHTHTQPDPHSVLKALLSERVKVHRRALPFSHWSVIWWNLLLVLNWSFLAHQIIQLLRFSLIFMGNWGSRLAKRMIVGWFVAQGRKVAGLAVSIGLTGYLLLLIRGSLWASAVQKKIPGVGRLPEWLPVRVTHIDQAHKGWSTKAESLWIYTEERHCEGVSGKSVVGPECSLSRWRHNEAQPYHQGSCLSS